MKRIQFRLFVSLLYLGLLNPTTNAAECTTTSPTSSSPCCNMGGDILSISFTYSRVDSNVYFCQNTQVFHSPPCVLCGEKDAQNTVSSQKTQFDVDQVYQFFASNNCFGGSIADAPGSNIQSLPDVTTSISRLRNAGCAIHFNNTVPVSDSTSICACSCCFNATCSTELVGKFNVPFSAQCTDASCLQQYGNPCTNGTTIRSNFKDPATQTTTNQATGNQVTGTQASSAQATGPQASQVFPSSGSGSNTLMYGISFSLLCTLITGF